MLLSTDPYLAKIDESFFECAPRPLFSGEAVEDVQNCVKGGEGVRFQSAERTKPEPAKIVLKFTQVVPAQTQVADKISSAFEVTQMDVIQLAGKMLLCLQHIETYGQKSSNEGLNFIGDAAAHRKKPRLSKASLSYQIWRLRRCDNLVTIFLNSIAVLEPVGGLLT